MSISFNGYILDAANDFWTFPESMCKRISRYIDKPADVSWDEWYFSQEEPPPNPLYDMRLDCNLSNTNAREVMNIIGLDIEESGPILVEQFINLVAVARRKFINKPTPALADVTVKHESGPTFIHCGRREGYVEETLKRLSELAQAAKEYHCTHIYWG